MFASRPIVQFDSVQEEMWNCWFNYFYLKPSAKTEDTEFELNLHYNNKRTKFKILPVTRAEVIQVT